MEYTIYTQFFADQINNFTWEYFAAQLINGVTLGSIYAIIAIGYTMVYGIIGMINFAHGDIFMIGGYNAFLIIMLIGISSLTPTGALVLSLIFVLFLGMFITSVWGWVVERIAYRPLRSSFRLAPLITGIGMAIVLRNFAQTIQGARVKAVPDLIVGSHKLAVSASGFEVIITNIQILVMISSLLLMIAFTIVIRYTSLGRAQRACQQDQTMAALIGVNVDKIISLTFAIGAALASVAASLYLVQYKVWDFSVGFIVGIKAFTAAVLGGIGSIPGAVFGGLLLGIIESMWSGYFPISYKDVASFSILVIVLIFMPHGILGKPEIQKV